MKRIFLFATAVMIAVSCGQQTVDESLKAVDFIHVNITDSFWRPRMEANVNVTIPHSLEKCEAEGRFANFRRAAGLEEGQWQGHFGFDDSDVYKVMEGMAFTYNVSHDEALRKQMDEIISLIGAAQCEDGYLYTAYQLRVNDYAHPWCVYKNERYDNLVSSHEFYNMGHMYEAAAAHYIATGQTNFLDIAIKSADHIYDIFGPGKRNAIPGHQEIELGLLKLTRCTGNPKYAELAKLFLDRRGHGLDDASAYNQNDEPVTEQKYARGHAVRANYMYSAMADVAMLLDDSEYAKAVDNLWEDVVNTKFYITGGFGARYDGESYGDSYELPNASYNETCAAIAGAYWNQRMFLLHGESKYVDVLERVMYNGLISGISLDGTKFFYPNPLTADGTYNFNQGNPGRSEWFDCSCCPTNDCRFMSSIPGYVYATKGNAIYENLYVSNEAEITLGKSIVKLSVDTDYPWAGDVRTTIKVEKPLTFAMNLRIPMWAQGKPVPGDLYSYVDSSAEEITISVNGEKAAYTIVDGYASVERKWSDGDVIEINLPMPVREVVASDKVEADRGLVAIERGPIVYCFEEIDNGKVIKAAGKNSLEDAKKADILISKTAEFTPSFQADLLGGVVTLSDGSLTAVPYCVWDNRGDGQMSVWLKK